MSSSMVRKICGEASDSGDSVGDVRENRAGRDFLCRRKGLEVTRSP